MRASKACWVSAWPREGAIAAVAALGVALSACATPAQSPGPQAAAIAAARVERQDSPYRPRLTLVERDGDPERGVALAVYVPASASAALALSLLVEARVRDAGLPAVAAHASASGFIMHALAAGPEDVRRFIQAANAALIAPVTAPEVERVALRWRAAPPRQGAASAAAVARCSGELIVGPDAEGLAAVPTRLALWLASVRAGDAAFAVVGTREHLDAGTDALRDIVPWTRLGTTAGLAFGAELGGAETRPTGPQSLSIALWGLPPATAIASAERLGEADAMLGVRLGAGFPPWRVWRVASSLSRGGACLRVDLQATGAPPALSAMGTSVSNAIDELEYTLARVKPGPWVVAKQVLVMEGPDQAAAVAAWQAVSATEMPAPLPSPQRIVHYSGPLADAASGERVTRTLATPPGTAPPGLELRRTLEPGQGQFWMLLATPCGTVAEDGTSAGALALALHAASRAHDAAFGVTLEPWLSVDGMGIVAHGPASTPFESAGAHAERVAEALARAVLSAGPAPDSIAASREALLEGLPSGPAPGLALALRQTTANHPSYLDARGTWAALTAISARGAQLERERFVRSKLRLASLGNHDEAQIAGAERRLISLLRSVDPGPVECPARGAVASTPGKYVIDAPGVRDADAVVAIPLPPSLAGPSEEGRWTEWLMNRPGGWLQQALQRPGLVSTARARVLGGASAAALVIEIHAVDDKHEEAVAQVRGLLERLRSGAANAADVRSAREHVARVDASRRLNPRARLVDLWYGVRRPQATLESLHALHRAAFEAGREVVVMTRPTE